MLFMLEEAKKEVTRCTKHANTEDEKEKET